MVVKQYPYMLLVKTVTGGGFDDDGNPIPASEVFEPHSKCRDEANTGGRVINLVDGSAYVFETLIQLPKNTPEITVGTTVHVMQDSVVRVSGTVKRFRQDQMHCRLWL